MARRRRFDPAETDPDELEEELEEKLEEKLEEEEDSAFRDGILRNHAVARVPLYMKDGSINPNLTPTQRGKAAQQTQDAVARRFGLTDGLQLHRPGFRRNTDSAALERSRQAYADADTQAANAWRGNDQRAGDPCTVRGPEYPLDFGSAGTLQKRNGDWVCVPNKKRHDAAALDSKVAAYADYDREMANAWRGGK